MKVLELITEVRRRYPLCPNKAYIALGMAGEAGELLEQAQNVAISAGKIANLSKKKWGGYQDVDTQELKRELADVINYALHMMLNLNMTMEDLDAVCCAKAQEFLAKLNKAGF